MLAQRTPRLTLIVSNRNGSDSTRRALFARNMSAAKNADEESK
jgi:hypothetical protein